MPGQQLIDSSRIFIIAEAGVNHNGDVDIAKRLIDAAVQAGADAVKFQTFSAERIASRSADKADYQRAAGSDKTETQYKMLKRLELSHDVHRILIEYCGQRGVTFLSSPFSVEDIDFLVDLGLDTIKIPSGEITNLPYLRRVGQAGVDVILSTGMADLGEIEDALRVLTESGTPKENIVVLHCNTEYPTPMEDVNLRAMSTISAAFQVRVGYSDHTMGIEIPIAAAALGAEVIEKHFTLDRNMEGPDHRASLEPDELAAMVKAIRNVEAAMGFGIKAPSQSEAKNIHIARKSIVAAEPISEGEQFTVSNLAVKRIGVAGVSPMQWDRLLGRRAGRSYRPDEPIEW